MDFLQRIQVLNVEDELRKIKETLMTRKRKTTKHYSRKWLNKGRGTAYICVTAEHEYDIDRKGKESAWVYSGVEIKDCYRQARLEFDYDNEKERKEVLQKLAVIQQELKALETFIRANEAFNIRPIKKPKEVATVDIETIEGELTVTTEAINDRGAMPVSPDNVRRVLESTAIMRPNIEADRDNKA